MHAPSSSLTDRSQPADLWNPHIDDDSNNVSLALDPSSGAVPCKTTWTLLLYLTSSAEGCVGGETVFFPNDRRSAKEEIPVALETGMLLLHKHGDDCMLVSLFRVPFCLLSLASSEPMHPSLIPDDGQGQNVPDQAL
ncbi:uncharacterized protein CTRU02_207400 [Colletotrichum truncatum]|uniref:Uncharacterized protein n=1 Tax=Colletotrichum truncatum TaxID=5467 RepID=A0ACC3Z0R5_COLTU